MKPILFAAIFVTLLYSCKSETKIETSITETVKDSVAALPDCTTQLLTLTNPLPTNFPPESKVYFCPKDGIMDIGKLIERTSINEALTWLQDRQEAIDFDKSMDQIEYAHQVTSPEIIRQLSENSNAGFASISINDLEQSINSQETGAFNDKHYRFFLELRNDPSPGNENKLTDVVHKTFVPGRVNFSMPFIRSLKRKHGGSAIIECRHVKFVEDYAYITVNGIHYNYSTDPTKPTII